MAENKSAGRPKKVEDVKETIVDTKVILNNEKEDLIKKNEEQETLISNLTKQNQDSMSALEMLQKQMQEMQNAFIKMQSNVNVSSSNNTTKSDEKFEMGCRLISGVTIYSPKREVEREIPYGETIEVNEYEIEMLLKSPFVREFLINNVVYLKNEEDYAKIKIYKHVDMSDENLINMVMKYSSNELVGKFNELTQQKRNDPVIHSLFYRLVELYSNGDIARMTYENRKVIETFFKYDITNAQTLLENIKKVK